MATVLETGYAIYPSVELKNYTADSKGKKKFGVVTELLFGDYIKPTLKNGDYVKKVIDGVEYIKVRSRYYTGYIQESDMQAERILEVNFVDVGQGDGCHIATPDDTHFLIDAGGSENMYRFLKWRFNIRKASVAPPPFTVVISHSDQDHYQGFEKIFDLTQGAAQQFKINKIYHNGMIEESGTEVETLGTIVKYKNRNYVTDLCDTNEDFEKRVAGSNKQGEYIKLLKKTTAPKEAVRYGSGAIYDNCGVKMEIVGPVAEKIDGKDALPVFESNKGKTKNGHSVIIKLTMGHLRLLLGGDLNTKSEYNLIRYFSGTDIQKIKTQLEKATADAKRKELEAELEKAILKTRETLEVDIAKSCHHGSADFSSEFLKVLNPIATIISSGDEEPHVHPRPDTLGTIGKHSRGERSLIFSTELARSSKEFVELSKINPKNESEQDEIRERTVTVYGMINVRTDGEKVLIAQRLEKPMASRCWDIHPLVWNEQKGEFEYTQYLKYK